MSHKWYIIHSASGSEKKVSQEIWDRAAKNKMTEYFEEIVVPTENIVEVKRGKKVDSEKKLFPGYILIKMHLTDNSWRLVKDLRRVTGFLGDGKRPMEISEKEVENILKQIEDGSISSNSTIKFDIGEQVKIVDGPFESFVGVVEDVDAEKTRLKVSVSIFGRATPVDLLYSQVVKED